MVWTEKDYPASMKNLSSVVRKKAIDIANAMIDEGYSDSQAIPIATTQAKEWYENASESERKDYEAHGDPESRSDKDKAYESHPERLDEMEQVVSHEKGWAVKSSGAERVTEVFDLKENAIKRAKEIAKNKGTGITIFNKDGSVQREHAYE